MKKIIITGDNWLAIGKRHEFFARANMRIITAISNAEAYDLHRREQADLIIGDLDSPDMNGEMLCTRIRASQELKHVSLMIVCQSDNGSIERSERCNANEFLIKPINRDSLLLQASKLLNVSMRTTLRVPVILTLRGTVRGMPFIGRSVNISTSGMLIETRKVLDEGDRISCMFSLPSKAQISAEAEVVRILSSNTFCEVCQYGVRFSEFPPEHATAIEDFIEDQAYKA